MSDVELSRLVAEREALERRIGHLRRKAARAEAPTKQHLQAKGEFTGLWVRTAGSLTKAGFTTREQLRALYARDGWLGLCRIKGVGKYAIAEIEAWLGERNNHG